ncbi:MAG TPA: hypothetical protein PKD85_17650 [Saprospiraceae bacterium]|nr:hypothetical protein [Saprospiraceae bacterium]
MERLTTFLLLCIAAITFIVIIQLGPSKIEKMSWLNYLNQYEGQDWYRENPTIWPVSSIPQTVENEVLREQKNR